MPRLTNHRPEKGADYRWVDRQVREYYSMCGTIINMHKYLGPIDQGATGDATQPSYAAQSEFNIQDILFMENRDRKYDTDVYTIRGHYNRSDNDFDLTQFGIFLQTGTIVMTFHYNDMLAMLGRKIMNGDVLELTHLQDDDVLDLEGSLKRYYVVGDCTWAAEGFSVLWYPHIWRCKLTPLVDSQEYKDILNQIKQTNTSGPKGTNTATGTLGDLMSTYQKYINVNEAVIAQAEAEVPKSGYDVSKIFSYGADKDGNTVRDNLTSDSILVTSDNTDVTGDAATFSPVTGQNPEGWLSGDGIPPNGLPVTAGVSFPTNPNQGDYHIRLDYLPNRMFRYSGTRWVKVEDVVRTKVGSGPRSTATVDGNDTLRNSFANNLDTLTIHHPVINSDGTVTQNDTVIPSSQGLSKVLRPKADY